MCTALWFHDIIYKKKYPTLWLVHDIQMPWYDWCETHTLMWQSDWCDIHILMWQSDYLCKKNNSKRVLSLQYWHSLFHFSFYLFLQILTQTVFFKISGNPCIFCAKIDFFLLDFYNSINPFAPESYKHPNNITPNQTWRSQE